MAIAVIAGTPFDAGLGADLLRTRGLAATAHPMAASPDEQDGLQYQGADALRAAFCGLVDGLAATGSTVAMLFCNSLSAVVDQDAGVSRSTRAMTVVSPVTVYREIAAGYRRPLVVGGNGTAIVGYERTTARVGAGHRALCVSDPALVRAIEHGEPADAFRASNLPAVLRLAERGGLDSVVLACTHFTAILPLVSEACDLPVIDVGSRIVELTATTATV